MTKRSLLLATVSPRTGVPGRAWALKATVDKLDDLPEALHAEYVQQGDKYVLQVEGMKPQADFDNLQRAHNTEKQAHTTLKTRVALLGDHKIEDVVTQLDRIPELEAAADGKLDDDKINGIVEGRVKTRIAPLERDLKTAQARVGELEGTVGELNGREKRRKIRDDVRAAAKKAGVTDEAMDDALLLGDNIFELRDDDGKTVVKEGVSYTQGMEPAVLFTDLQSKKPHWFGESRGGGAGGSNGVVRGATNPWSKANWNVTEQGRVMTADPTKAEQFAKAAGHKSAAEAKKTDAK